MKLIKRKQYLDKLISVKNTPDIKVITGVRRSGKSKLLESFIKTELKKDESANIISLNLTDPTNESYLEYHALYDYIESQYASAKNNYVLIDEIQMCEGFEHAVIGLHNTEKYDIYITGSNAFLLSSDLATLFTGRTFEIEVFPFSFVEFCTYFEFEPNNESLNKYFNEGGMSGSYVYNNENEKYTYLNNVYKTLILRDIVQKYNIRKPVIIDNLSNYLMDNISNITSIRKITKELTKAGLQISNVTIASYTDYLCNAFSFYKINKYNIRGKKYLNTNCKYYLCDHSFRYAKLGKRNMDYGRILENIVAIEFLRRGYEVYTGALYDKEVDFVAIKQDEKLYVQVSNDLSLLTTFDREVSPLLKIQDAYPKIILSRINQPSYSFEGVHIIDVVDWLSDMQ
ncbi:MAG: ATP-binding protein [Coriobacteriia bacterium]|nr:ATP-binding protein [Coriobacteriia bacterium]